MIVNCEKCKRKFDDEFRDTGCPHSTFAANDGHNNFKHYTDSYISPELDDAITDELKNGPKSIMGNEK